MNWFVGPVISWRLGSATSGFEAVLLALLHSGVAGQEAGGLQSGAVLGVQAQQGAGHAVADGAGLAGDAAAGDGDNQVNLAQGVGGDQGLADQQLQGLQAEVLVDIAAVDGDGAGAVLIDATRATEDFRRPVP